MKKKYQVSLILLFIWQNWNCTSIKIVHPSGDPAHLLLKNNMDFNGEILYIQDSTIFMLLHSNKQVKRRIPEANQKFTSGFDAHFMQRGKIRIIKPLFEKRSLQKLNDTDSIIVELGDWMKTKSVSEYILAPFTTENENDSLDWLLSEKRGAWIRNSLEQYINSDSIYIQVEPHKPSDLQLVPGVQNIQFVDLYKKRHPFSAGFSEGNKVYAISFYSINSLTVEGYNSRNWGCGVLQFQVLPALGLAIAGATVKGKYFGNVLGVLSVPILITTILYEASTPSAPEITYTSTLDELDKFRVYARFPYPLQKKQLEDILAFYEQSEVIWLK